MAGFDDEMVEGSSNQERQLYGLAGDDDEDDLREDAAELFGRNVQAPIVLEPCDDQAVDGKRITTSGHVPLAWQCGLISRNFSVISACV